MVTPQRALTGVLGPRMAQTGSQGPHGVAKLYMLIHWVGSPDLGIVHLFPLGCSAPNAKSDQENGHFRFLARGSKFSKGALRAVGAIAFVAAAGGTFHVRRRRCTSKLLLTARCAAQAFLFAACAAAVLQAHQLCSWSSRRLAQEQEQRKRSIGKRAALVAECNSSVEFFLPPVFSKGK